MDNSNTLHTGEDLQQTHSLHSGKTIGAPAAGNGVEVLNVAVASFRPGAPAAGSGLED